MIMSTRNYTSLGIMTGTSLDGVDISLISSDGYNKIIFIDGKTYKFSNEIKKLLKSCLGAKKNDSIIDLAEHEYTDYVIQKIKDFLKNKKNKIDVIGFNGQTINHSPNSGFSWQLGNAKKISKYFKVKTVYNFRENDIKNGGNGAPLSPIYHYLLKNKFKMKNVAFLNLGGISNLTIISNRKMIALDCGPCCSISDEFTKKFKNKSFDHEGKFAFQGKEEIKIVKNLLRRNYFKIKPPKSLDRLDFTINDFCELNVYDGLATINRFIVETVYLAIKEHIKNMDYIVLLGGGRKNLNLISKLKNKFGKKIKICEDFGINGDLTESNAFAYLAIRFLKHLPISYPGTTGVKKPTIGGKLVL